MAAKDHLSGIQFKTTKGKSKGISHTTIRAYQGDRNVGYAKMTEGGRFLDSLEVRPEARGSGIGHALMDQVTGQFGDSTLRLHASPFGKGDHPDRDALQKFYGQHGFEPESADGYMIRRPLKGS